MGYTHYWTLKGDLDRNDGRLENCIKDMQMVCDNSPVPLAGPFGEKGTNVKVDGYYKSISFNGEQPDDYETFRFPGDRDFNFCKTQYRPYDMIVTACLLVVAKYFYDNEIEVNSDGNFEDWKDGIAFFHGLFDGKDPDNPINLLRQIPWNHPEEDE